ncbi:MarR family transcriptional regulator [[Actinomadura] parvosata subsp. kistnae]|uniref:MarR family transcriptional regulator n=2 Tax=Nonomuraea TaxID=83681 RepID=A0A1V0AMK7_9ACTN|nr:MarR family transcriptional regulator [Nonomuraea sp. ATCC 55076]AQZ71438.1 MarR family transcriptional regulator [Nonomuraea sp. ATCC 55076]NJP95274.1 MarR family transcriptional regulator [Nonomuraea sp. FMUSA5-5]
MSTDLSGLFRRYLSATVLNSLATAEAAGLNATDYYAHNLLDLMGPLTSGELAAQTGLTTGATTRLIDRLEKAGFVRRRPDPADRRKVMVESVSEPEGLDEVLKGTRARLRTVFEGFSEAELAVLCGYFERATAAYREATDELITARNA